MTDIKRCEHCGKEINARYSGCPFCGGDAPEKVTAVRPECPRCNAPLGAQTHGGEEYDLCPSCGGLWLDRGEFRLLTSEYDVYRNEKPRGSSLREPARDPMEYIPCVRCGKMMNRKHFGRISGVIIDECRSHGVWLDAGEIEKIRHVIADGGLERSQDREIEQVRTELRELAT